MHITFTPMRLDEELTLEKQGDVLIINGEAFDFTPLPEGHILPRAAVVSDWLVSDVTRVSGVVQMTLILPHGAQAPRETLFPVPLLVTGDGPVKLPAHSPTVQQTEDQP
ncbi:hypothetical protein [Phaeobacter sp. 11ANDIMAR09]|uniref:hypothetical protein n=1 Tax=Phaeobacter sp. 11ANDIMAR09 TaxID=1225647 RepID=UPI0006C871B1|nr:hypothetical protein [Phaeobacter sp. 11ANDIMAR09]KPD10859.1 hypothetical protein AN476_18555 [Phaeobacter sp. 11ANDIMAR09]